MGLIFLDYMSFEVLGKLCFLDYQVSYVDSCELYSLYATCTKTNLIKVLFF